MKYNPELLKEYTDPKREDVKVHTLFFKGSTTLLVVVFPNRTGTRKLWVVYHLQVFEEAVNTTKQGDQIPLRNTVSLFILVSCEPLSTLTEDSLAWPFLIV